MEKNWRVEKVEKSNGEELLRLIPRRGPLGIGATKTILKQNPTTDELLAVLDGLGETKIQLQLQKEVLAELFRIGLPLDDALALIQLKDAVIAEIIWDKLRQEKQVKELSLEELEDIFDITDSPKVKKEAEKELELRGKKNIVIPYL